ncbi:hypothetical protein MAP00_001025 [Monascus purpureus]|nr:hypothetical protein MAP00_001025 [Monascus purpureus]
MESAIVECRCKKLDFGHIVSGHIFTNAISTGYPKWAKAVMRNIASIATCGFKASKNGLITVSVIWMSRRTYFGVI